MNDITFVVFGASGDLTKRKLLPALYTLFLKKKLTKFLFVGAAYDDITVAELLNRVRPFITDFDEVVWHDFIQYIQYQKLNFNELADFNALKKVVDRLEKKQGLSGNRLLYCATASDFFCKITSYIAQSGIAEKRGIKDTIWHRIVYEKPFGYDGTSAREINQCIEEHFNETQIYRIDHYLTKELVGNIALVRFTNCVFEPLWNNRYIDNVQVVVSEQVGVEGRGSYYDTYGALKDMVQNHMLEMVSLIAMETPEKLTGEFVRKERVRVLERVRFDDVLFGQYRGYRNEVGVRPDSQTETFVALKAYIDNPRWAGVPFYLKTGKKLDKKETVIHLKFKQVDCLLSKNCPSDTNYLTIMISPDATFSLTLNVKKPGVANEVVPINMDFCHSCLFGDVVFDSYVILLQEIMRGEQSVSVRSDEIECAWKVVDSIDHIEVPLDMYEPGSDGPKELKDFEYKHGMRWRS